MNNIFIYNKASNEIVEKATMAEPVRIIQPQPFNEHTLIGNYICPYCGRHSSTSLTDMQHDCPYGDYQKHLASLLRHTCHPSCKKAWKDGQDVTGKFELITRTEAWKRYGREDMSGDGFIAYPLTQQESEEELLQRFIKPTDDQMIGIALLFNDGRLDAEELSNMVGMCQLVVDRLYENGDILIPSSKENK